MRDKELSVAMAEGAMRRGHRALQQLTSSEEMRAHVRNRLPDEPVWYQSAAQRSPRPHSFRL